MKRTKTEKGITLIALIITVIILLILAVVAIGAVQNDGIIQHAKNARDEYNQAQQNEQTILQNYVDILDNETENKPEPEDSLVAMYKAGKIKVGDYVDYTPTTASAVNPDGTEAPGTLTGYTDEAQSIVQEDLNWRVLGYDKTKNELLLISGSPTKTTNGGIHFYGHTGYNNYEDVLNTTCSKLYSNSTLGVTARSITMNDIDTYYSPINRINATTFRIITNLSDSDISFINFWKGNDKLIIDNVSLPANNGYRTDFEDETFCTNYIWEAPMLKPLIKEDFTPETAQ